MDSKDWTVMTIVLALMVLMFTAAAIVFPEKSTCLAYQEPYRSACANMDDTNKGDVYTLFYESRGYLQ